MKCPQCSSKMKKLDAAGFKWYCTSPRCVFWKEVILTARAIRAIRRKLGAEYNRGFDVGLFAGKKSKEANP